jgi:hypothetical protein
LNPHFLIRGETDLSGRNRRKDMKRAISMAMLALSPTLGSARMYAYPNGPCAPTVIPSTEASLSGVFFLLLPIFVPSIG